MGADCKSVAKATQVRILYLPPPGRPPRSVAVPIREHRGMKLGVSLSGEDVAVLDAYVEKAGLPSPSASLQRGVQMLPYPALEDDYAQAWSEWSSAQHVGRRRCRRLPGIATTPPDNGDLHLLDRGGEAQAGPPRQSGASEWRPRRPCTVAVPPTPVAKLERAIRSTCRRRPRGCRGSAVAGVAGCPRGRARRTTIRRARRWSTNGCGQTVTCAWRTAPVGISRRRSSASRGPDTRPHRP